jgi:hypothetical protein
MKIVIRCAGFFLLLTMALGAATPSFAQTPEATPAASGQTGSVIVFPKFVKGTLEVDGVPKARTEIEIQARCPSNTTCPVDEPIKIRFHWVCPGIDDISTKDICKESGFDISLSPNGKVVLNPENSTPARENPASSAPCPSGYLIGWVIDATTNQPIKYDGLTGSTILRDARGTTESSDAIAIPADPTLAVRANITTEIDSRTGTPSLVFDGGAGHYQALSAGLPASFEFHKLTGPLSTSEASLILLTLDVRLNRPNYPTFIDLDFRSDQGVEASTSWNFTCWTEIQNPTIDAYFTLVGALTHDGVIISGRAIKVPFGGISDVPGPVTLLGLAPSDEGRKRHSMHRAYIAKKFDEGKRTTVLVPFD